MQLCKQVKKSFQGTVLLKNIDLFKFFLRIIEPITSRCSKFRFKPLSREILFQRLEYICKQEKVDFEKDVTYKIKLF